MTQGITVVEHTKATFHIDQSTTHKTYYIQEGVDSITYAWTEVCPYTGKKVLKSKTVVFNGKDEWVVQ